MKKYPFYFKSTVTLFGLILLCWVIFYLRDILVAPAFALLLALLLNPLVNRLQGWKVPRVLAIVIALIVSLLVIAGVGYFLYWQVSSFSSELPEFKKKFLDFFTTLQQELNHRFGIDMKKQNQMISEAETNIKPLVGSAIGNVANTVGVIILLPVFSFLFLYYKTLLLNFLYEISSKENSENVGTVLAETKKAIQSYMVGLLLEALIVATLNSVSLLIIGIKYAVLLGVLGAVINVLPFIGGIVAVILPLLIATVTKDGFQSQLWIIIAYAVIQFVDNHFLVPYIVSSRVKINALISIMIVLFGGVLWGIAGMFLAIPFIGVLKIIFDRIPELKPWGKLFGDEVPTRHKGQVWRRGSSSKASTAKTSKKAE